MNFYFLAAGAVALFIVIGHFVVGTPRYLVPALKADFEPVARNIVHALFHYVSAFLILAAGGLLAAGAGLPSEDAGRAVAGFIALNFAGFAAVQMRVALQSGLAQPLLKLFQWMLFGTVAGMVAAGLV